MGGYLSGRPASDKPSVENCIRLDVCYLYRQGHLEPGNEVILKNRRGGLFHTRCCENYFVWPLCVCIAWTTIAPDQTRKEHQQIIGVEYVDVLNGKARRPYFLCPFTEKRAVMPIMARMAAFGMSI